MYICTQVKSRAKMEENLQGKFCCVICFISDNVERRIIERERLQHELSEYDDKLNRQVEG